MTQASQPPKKWNRQARLVSAVLGSIPLSIGQIIRRWAYRPLMKKIGQGVILETGLDLFGTSGISLHDGAVVGKLVHLDSGSPTGELILQKGASLDHGVNIRAYGGTIDIGEDKLMRI